MAGLGQGSGERREWLSRLLYALSLVVLGFALVNLGWAVWPAQTDGQTFTIPAGLLPGAPSGKTYTSLADYTLQVSWPRWMRAGEAGQIVVALSEAAAPADEVVDRETQAVLIEPSLVGLPVAPPGRTQANLGPGQGLQQRWTVDGVAPGEFPGKLVVSFGFYDEVLGELTLVPVAVIDFSIRVATLWGLARGLVLWLGLVGLVLWGALFILGRLVKGEGG